MEFREKKFVLRIDWHQIRGSFGILIRREFHKLILKSLLHFMQRKNRLQWVSQCCYRKFEETTTSTDSWSSFFVWQTYILNSGYCWYFSNSATHSSSFFGHRSPNNFQFTIDKPDSVSRVTPPNWQNEPINYYQSERRVGTVFLLWEKVHSIWPWCTKWKQTFVPTHRTQSV